ncbi:F-box/WD repeat-containing protein 1A [Daldinia childiae]|uniref:F-box/WD repeat-containing protein 1A n=1 Tax=Daldinia childiae TaxID=326645 RepID=UPI0014485617|nr:F-box/WD repeat-containing protein 1A [Daldinia childiae]KAF3065098.1 F-box/WD repeat-containing protein 1A [Daldinia childiae]
MFHDPTPLNARSFSHDTGIEPGIEEEPTTPTSANPFRKSRNGSVSGEIKGKIRRASLSIKGIVRRERRVSESAAESNETRPTTSHSTWHKLRQAASFRHSRTSYGGPGTLETIYSPLETEFPNRPVPGNGLEPPIIPWHTGAAAKAAAALQNESLGHARYYQELVSLAESQNDRESGIGITFTASMSQLNIHLEESAPIIRKDFVAELPPELAVQILAHLDATQLAVASRVSKLWHNIAHDQHIWRQSFLREKTGTYATGRPVQPGTGFGVPSLRSQRDWQKIYKAREELDGRWKLGKQARAVFLNGHTDSVYCQQFDENKIITGSRDKTIRIWDMHTLQCRLIIGPPEVVNDSSLLFDPTGHPTHYALFPNEASVSPSVSPSVPVTVSFPIHHSASILCLQYDDEILVTGSSDSSCIIYNVRSGYRPVRRLKFHTAAVLDLAFDDKYIVTCSKDCSICVWDRATGSLIKQLNGHTGPVNAVQLRGNTLVSCSGDFTVKLWNIDSGKVIRELAGHTKGLACSQFSEDGRFVASAGSDKVIRIWDANTGECLQEIQAHQSLVRSLHIDSISGRLISGSYDTDIKVFDMETGQQQLDFPGWHASWVLSAKSDYRRIVSTGQDAKILIMDFGADVSDIRMLESARKHEVACDICDAGFI